MREAKVFIFSGSIKCCFGRIRQQLGWPFNEALVAQFQFKITVYRPLSPYMLLVVLLDPANNFPPSLTVNPEICWLTGADMVKTVQCGS